jgi:large conductance mechanosensitive channel
MSILKEFKEFAVRGNAIDLAVGIVIGASFGKIVSSLVSDVIMPLVGVITGGVDFSNKVIVLKEATGTIEAVTLNYGQFINSIIDFIIIAFAIFIVIKQINKLSKKEEEEVSKEDPKPSEEVKLLTEIRDNLNK